MLACYLIARSKPPSNRSSERLDFVAMQFFLFIGEECFGIIQLLSPDRLAGHACQRGPSSQGGCSRECLGRAGATSGLRRVWRGARGGADRRRDRAASREGAFFFQAEDGIRDYKVTGVQTCALPI